MLLMDLLLVHLTIETVLEMIQLPHTLRHHLIFLSHNVHMVPQGGFASHLSLDWLIILVGLYDSSQVLWVMMRRRTIFLATTMVKRCWIFGHNFDSNFRRIQHSRERPVSSLYTSFPARPWFYFSHRYSCLCHLFKRASR